MNHTLPDEPRDSDRQRDAASLVMIGTFFTVLALLVLCGTFWATGRFHAMMVNLGAGAILLIIGLLMLGMGLRMRPAQSSNPSRNKP